MSVTIGYEDFSRTLSYNDEGQISRSEGLLQKIEEDSWCLYPEEKEITEKVTRTYIWEGGD